MLGLAVRFDFGHYHATPWGTHVNEAMVEWPPSAWRLLRALYAAGTADITLAPLHDRLGEALAALASAPDPSYVVPAWTAAHTRHYMPLSKHSPTAADARSLVIDAFNVVDRDDELEVWWDVDLADELREAIARAAESLGYLGRSESVCTARLLPADVEPSAAFDVVPAAAATSAPWAAASGSLDLLAVEREQPDAIGVLTTSITAMRDDRRVLPAGTRRAAYLVRPREDLPPSPATRTGDQSPPTIAHLRIGHDERPALTEATVLLHVLRSALQRRFDRERVGLRSPVLSGHGPHGARSDQHRHAHYLALPGVDGRRIEHLFVWAPEGLPSAEVETIAGLSWLRLRDHEHAMNVALVALGDAPSLAGTDGSSPSRTRLLGPARTWTSLTPFVLPRHTKRRRGVEVDGPVDQILRELSWRGLDGAKVDLVPGRWMDFSKTRPGQPARTAGRAVGARLTFPEPIRGPVALGRLSHFGLGLFTADD